MTQAKVFCVGLPKTGTTSMAVLFKELGYDVAPQAESDVMTVRHNFDVPLKDLKDLCDRYDAFQDLPFCMQSHLDRIRRLYPDAKYILTVRSSAATWYSSVIRFYAQLCRIKKIPTIEDLHRVRFSESTLAVLPKVYGTTNEDPLNKSMMLDLYERHNCLVRQSFVEENGNFIEIDLSNEADLPRLLSFLGHDTNAINNFPHANKTKLKKLKS